MIGRFENRVSYERKIFKEKICKVNELRLDIIGGRQVDESSVSNIYCKSGEDYLVYVPDFDIYAEGKSFLCAVELARGAISLKGICMEDKEMKLPKSSTYKEATEKAKADIEDFDYTVGILTMVDIDFR